MEFVLVPMALNEKDSMHLGRRAARSVGAVQNEILVRTAASRSIGECGAVHWPMELSLLTPHGAHVIAITSLPFEDD
jgi:hypothetical protein